MPKECTNDYQSKNLDTKTKGIEVIEVEKIIYDYQNKKYDCQTKLENEK